MMLEEIVLEKEVDSISVCVSSPPSLRELVINFMARHSLYLIQENTRQRETQSPPDIRNERPRRNTCHCAPQ